MNDRCKRCMAICLTMKYIKTNYTLGADLGNKQVLIDNFHNNNKDKGGKMSYFYFFLDLTYIQ